MLLAQLAGEAALQANVLPRPWRTATVDYSAANEYIAAHYAHVHSKDYFATSAAAGQATEPIYDARLGVWDDEAGAAVPASLASCGFELQPSPTSMTCWSDADAVGSVVHGGAWLAAGGHRRLQSQGRAASAHADIWAAARPPPGLFVARDGGGRGAGGGARGVSPDPRRYGRAE